MKDLLPLLELVARRGSAAHHGRRHRERRAGNAGGQQDRGTFTCCAVRRPGSRPAQSRTGDIAPLRRPPDRGGVGLKLENVAEGPGHCKRIVVDKDNTTLIDGAGKKADIEGASNDAAQIRRPPGLRP
jgi:chaperonin GroEL